MEAFAKNLTEQIPHLRRYARYLVRDDAKADDLTQETLVKALNSADSWTPGTNLRAWLFVIMKNTFLSDMRRASRQQTTATPDQVLEKIGVNSNQESTVILGEVAAELMELPYQYREVLLLVVMEGMSYEDTAGLLEVPVGTVRSRLSRARKALMDKVYGMAEAESHESGQEPEEEINGPRPGKNFKDRDTFRHGAVATASGRSETEVQLAKSAVTTGHMNGDGEERTEKRYE